MNASLHLAFEKTVAGATVLRLRRQDPPWRVIRAFDGSLVHLHNVSGGVLSGDRLELRASLAPETRAVITTTSATRVYRRRSGADQSQSSAHFELGEGSLLDLLPDAVIPYADSDFAQHTSVDLSPGATLLWWEMLAPGREASGEAFRFARLGIDNQIRSAGVPIAMERAWLDPRERPLDAAARLGDCRYLATFYVCRAGETASAWRRLEEDLNAIGNRLMENENGVRWGVSRLVQDGVVVRGMAVRGAPLSAGLREFWQAARLQLTGERVSPPRKTY